MLTKTLIWKEAEVIALLKEGDHEVANNNRPVSRLPAISKICERVALNQLTHSFANQGLLSSWKLADVIPVPNKAPSKMSITTLDPSP
jgi:hypothetical protein